MSKKRLEVGDGVNVVGPDMSTLKGTVIDFCDYPDRRMLLIQLRNGRETEVAEEKAKKAVFRSPRKEGEKC
ncbi:MAG: hypothetical protein Q7S70_00315 [bacterium]|nr:hypothetical protein [bacterium]